MVLERTFYRKIFVTGHKSKPSQTYRRLRTSPKVTVCCTMSTIDIIGHYFLEDRDKTETLTSGHYCEMLKNFLQLKMEVHDRE